MRTMAFGWLAFALVGFAQGQEEKKVEETKKAEGPSYQCDFPEKAHGLKMKAATFDANRTSYVVLFEFIGDTKAEDLPKLRAAFRDGNNVYNGSGTSIMFHFFDGENVLIGKSKISKIDGELTGKKGDAFRVHFGRPTNIYNEQQAAAVKKIEARQADPNLTYEAEEKQIKEQNENARKAFEKAREEKAKAKQTTPR